MSNLKYDEVVSTLIEKLRMEYQIDVILSEDTNVLELGLDSLDIMNYIFFIEETYNVLIDDEKIESNSFLIIKKTAEYIMSANS